MELEIRTDSSKRLHLLERLNGYLLQQLTEGRNVVVMIDEAQTLDDTVLEELRLLSNLETAKEKILQMVLSGQPELEDKLRKPQLRQLRQRIGVRCTLKPMQASEIGAYVETRLRSAGADRADFFTPVGLRKVWQASGGIPRVINAICDNAMMIAFAEGKQRIDSGVVNEAVRDLHGDDLGSDVRSSARQWLAHPAARYVAAAVLALAFLIPSIANLMDAWQGMDDPAQPVIDTLAGPGGGPGMNPGSPVGAESVPLGLDSERDEDARLRVKAPERPVLAAAGEPRRELGVESAEPEAVAPPQDPIVAAARAASKPVPKTEHSSGVLKSIRRAELLARSTAARIYDGRRRTLEESAQREMRGESDDIVSDGYEAPDSGESLVAVVGGGRDVVGDDGFDDDFEALVAAAESEASTRMAEEAAEKAAAETLAKQAAIAEAAAEAAARKAALDQAAAEAASKQAAIDAAAKAEAQAEARELSQAVEKLAKAASTLAVAVEDGTAQDESAASQSDAGTDSAQGSESDAGSASLSGRLAALEASIETLGPRGNELILGRHVRVQPGDTIWDIAIGYYGTAGESALTRIMNNNPGIRDPRRLLVGAHVYLPFQRAERMVHADTDGTFRVLLTVSPKRSALEETRAWIKARGETVQLGSATVEGTQTLYHLYAISLGSRQEALALAERVLVSHAGELEERQTASRHFLPRS